MSSRAQNKSIWPEHALPWGNRQEGPTVAQAEQHFRMWKFQNILETKNKGATFFVPSHHSEILPSQILPWANPTSWSLLSERDYVLPGILKEQSSMNWESRGNLDFDFFLLCLPHPVRLSKCQFRKDCVLSWIKPWMSHSILPWASIS